MDLKIKNAKETDDVVISSFYPFKKVYTWFLKVPFNPLSDQYCGRYRHFSA